MQDEYLNNLNADALEVACIVAMDRPEKELTVFGSYCKEKDLLGKGLEILAKTIEKKFRFKEMKLLQKTGESQAKTSSSFVVFDQRQPQDIKRLQNKLNIITNAGISEDGIYGPKTSAAILRKR